MELFGIVEHDSEIAKQVQRVFARLHPIAERYNDSGKPFDWQIAVFRSPEISAWTMPGGKMVIHDALVKTLRLNDDELAVILAHEMAHVVKEHGKEQANVALAARWLGVFGGAAVSSAVNYAGSALAWAPEYAISKPFSRYSELEADRIGLLIMAQAGFDPKMAVRLWQKLYEYSDDEHSFLGQLAASHPSYDERKANIEKVLPQAMALYHQF